MRKFMGDLNGSANKVQLVLNRFGLKFQVIELLESTRTAKEAADAIGCELGQIAKSLIFQSCFSQTPICFIASGSNNIDEKKFDNLLGEGIKKANADFVAKHTGYAIGGIPPVGHVTPMRTFIDEDLFSYSEIWAAAGTPHAVFKLTPNDLVKITQGVVVPIKTNMIKATMR